MRISDWSSDVCSSDLQDVFLFDDSVQSNVAYADPDAGDDILVEATATAQMHDYVSSLPLGYGTPIGERGVGLSGGQRQRLSIARGMVPGPRIFIFDHAPSAVDAATGHRLRQERKTGVWGERDLVSVE